LKRWIAEYGCVCGFRSIREAGVYDDDVAEMPDPVIREVPCDAHGCDRMAPFHTHRALAIRPLA
jgi:hypothetical protein